MSPSQVHSAVKRALLANLAVRQSEKIVPHFRNLEEFLIHGLKYVFWAEQGEMTRGMPTAYAAPPLAELLVSSAVEPPPVWPDPDGEVRGLAFQPIYKRRLPRQRALIIIFTSCYPWWMRFAAAEPEREKSPRRNCKCDWSGMHRITNPNLEILEAAVELLDELIDQLVFLGGCLGRSK